MRSNRREFLSGLAAALALPLAARSAHANNNALAVICGKNNPVNSISRAELKRLFLGEQITISGQALVPFNAPAASPERLAFESAVLQMSQEEVTKTWVDKRIRGLAKPPKVAPEAAFLIKVAAAYPGAICYVPLAMVTPTVKVLAVDGKKPGEAGYPLG